MGLSYQRDHFNNRKNTSKRKGAHSRSGNEYKKRIYEQIKYLRR